MLASELLKKVQDFIQANGDLPVSLSMTEKSEDYGSTVKKLKVHEFPYTFINCTLGFEAKPTKVMVIVAEVNSLWSVHEG